MNNKNFKVYTLETIAWWIMVHYYANRIDLNRFLYILGLMPDSKIESSNREIMYKLYNAACRRYGKKYVDSKFLNSRK